MLIGTNHDISPDQPTLFQQVNLLNDVRCGLLHRATVTKKPRRFGEASALALAGSVGTNAITASRPSLFCSRDQTCHFLPPSYIQIGVKDSSAETVAFEATSGAETPRPHW